MSERQHTRVMAPVGVMLEGAEETCAAFTRNVSRGGMFVVTKLRAEQGEFIKILLMHSGKKLRCSAEVMNVTEEGLGLKFSEADEAFLDGVEELIKSLLVKAIGKPKPDADSGGFDPDNYDYDASGAPNDDAANADGGDDGSEEISRSAAKARVTWSYLPDGHTWNWWRKGLHDVRLVALSHDGATFISRKRPACEETVLLFITTDTVPDAELHCRAEVMRHTDKGFVVRYLEPRLQFRQAIGQMRQAGIGRRDS